MPFAPLKNDDEILARAIDCMETGARGWEDIREHMRECVKFRRNDMWSDEAKASRGKSRPAYTFNVIDRFADNVVGRAIGNPRSIGLRPIDGKTDRFKAWIKEGIIRAIQYKSQAQIAQTQAVNDCAVSGVGYIRLIADYENARTMRKSLFIDPVYDNFTVTIDPRSYRPDTADADWFIVAKIFGRDDLVAEYGEKALVDVSEITDELKDWFETDEDATSVKKYVLAEFWWKERKKSWLALVDGAETPVIEKKVQGGVELILIKDAEGTEVWTQAEEVREVDDVAVKMVLLAGHKVLTEPIEWGIPRFPIYPVYGRQVIAEGKRTLKSLFTNALDSQRLLNASMTSAAEIMLGAPKNKWLAAMKVIKNYMNQFWTKANDPSITVLPYDPDPSLPNGGKPTWEAFPVSQAGQFAVGGQVMDLIKYTTGMSEAQVGEKGNEKSGRALQFRMQESQATVAYIPKALDIALECLGRDLAELIPKYYTGSRVVQAILEEDGGFDAEPVSIGLGNQQIDGQQDLIIAAAEKAKIPINPHALNALSLEEGTYDIVVTTVQAMPTRRVEAQELFEAVLPSLPPEDQRILLPHMFDLMDMPGGKEIASKLEEAHLQGPVSPETLQAVAQMLLQSPEFGQAMQAITAQTIQEMVGGMQQ